jgi:hypothetical protein
MGSNEAIAIVDLDDAKDAVIHIIVHVISHKVHISFCPKAIFILLQSPSRRNSSSLSVVRARLGFLEMFPTPSINMRPCFD